MPYLAKTQVIKVNSARPEKEAIALAASLLHEGKLVAFPTETVYGLGANAFDPAAIDHIFEAKNRPTSDPIIVHIHDLSQLDDISVNIPDITWKLARIYWPGPLTLVLERNKRIPANVSAGLDTVAVRMPDHSIPQTLIQVSGLPIAAPSANLFARPSPTTADHVYSDLKDRVDLILDGGPCTIGLESTVLDLTQDPPVLLRPGGTPLESLRQVIPGIQFLPKYLKISADQAPAASPGMLSKHYSPQAKLVLFTGNRSEAIAKMIRVAHSMADSKNTVGVMIPAEDEPFFEGAPVIRQLLGSQADLLQISHNLFAAMRDLDAQSVDVILIRDMGSEGLGLAIWDRLVRASDGTIVNASDDS